MNQHSETMNTFLQDAHGEIPYGMTNDCMFRAVLQENNKALRGLVCSLLHLSESEVISAVVTNPIVLGEKTADKEFRLDINVVLNNEILINLEMQVANRPNWHNRSVMYLCRSFDRLNHGQDYTEAKPAVHIGFLDYTLFPDRPEFYASYKLINVKNHYTYNDSLTLHVLDLTRIDLATEEDKRYHIHEWAAFFKAATWEEVKMIAAKNEPIQEAAETMFRWSAEDQMQKWLRDREEYYLDQRANERLLAEKDEKIKQLLAENEALKQKNS
ncbi:MAG: Rpn family recombination-promoting nuclease/putative transposase [Bacteroidales bacterium]|nr:Rpn family recombination-promoting nuclease/putative transposase [Bacteroidales bacterium]